MTLQHVINDTNLLDLPVVFTGDWVECQKYAEKENYFWKNSRKYLFGGYFYNPDTKDCLMPT